MTNKILTLKIVIQCVLQTLPMLEIMASNLLMCYFISCFCIWPL